MSFASADLCAEQAQDLAGPALAAGRGARAPVVAKTSIGAGVLGLGGGDGRACIRGNRSGARAVTDERCRSPRSGAGIARS
jgi:hypothetical protein